MSSLYRSLTHLVTRSQSLMTSLEPRLPTVLATASKESRLVAYRKMLESELGITLPKTILKLKIPTDPYGNPNTPVS